jgi:hypothetical protein
MKDQPIKIAGKKLQQTPGFKQIAKILKGNFMDIP